ncbi:MAG: hypothetical protein AAF840_12985, partial [Bacteroidota bacterium]
MRFPFLLLFSLLSFYCFAQSSTQYQNLVDEAFACYQSAAPQKAIKLYRQAFTLGQGRTLDILRAAAASQLAKKEKQARAFLAEGFAKDPVAMATFFLYQPEFQSLREGPMLDEVKEKTIIALRKYPSGRYQPLFSPGEFEVSDLTYAFHASLASEFFQRENYEAALLHYQDAFAVKNTNVHSLLRASVAAAFAEQAPLTQAYLGLAFAKMTSYALTYVRLHEDFEEGFKNPVFLKALNQQILVEFPEFDTKLTTFIDETWAEFA